MKKLVCVLVALSAFGFAPRAGAMEVHFEQDESLPIVYLNVAVKTGAVTDPKGESGITNFLGEMLLRGTRARSKEQIDLALDQMGGRLEVETRAEALVLRGAVLASQLDPFLQLVQEIVVEPSFPEHQIRKLRSEVVSSLLDELGDDQSLARRFYEQFLFLDHPYGNPVMGTISDVQKLTRAELQAQYDRLFRDKLLLVVGTGDASSSTIASWAEKIAQARPGGEELQPLPVPQDPPHRKLLLVDKPDRTQTQIYGGQVGVRMTDKDFFPLYLANYAFGGGSFSARLMLQIRVQRGWSYGAYSYFRQGTKPRSWQFYLFPAAKDTPAALAYTLGMVDKLQKSGITQDEFRFAQESLVNSSGFMYNTPRKRVENILLERTLNLPDGFMKSYGPKLKKVTLSEVNHAIESFLQPAHLAVTVLGTAKDLEPKLIQATGFKPEDVTVVPYTREELK